MQTLEDTLTSPTENVADPGEVYAFPATPQQQQLWFLDSIYLGNPSYNIPLAYDLTGPVDLDALDRSLAWVVSRHENLRTTFALRGDEFLQVVEPSLNVRFARIDLSGLSADARERQRRQTIAAESRHRFDLARGPLVRATLLVLAPEQHVLMFNFHHIILDHLAVLQFAREFCHAYGRFRAGREPDLAEPALQYPDFSIWQNEQLQAADFQADLQAWVEQLKDSPMETSLPFDRPRGSAQTFNGREVKFSLPADLSNRVREFARRSKKSVFVTLLTAFKCLLGRYSGQTDIIVGSPFSNRTVANLEDVMGCCMNTLPLRTDLKADGTFAEAMAAVHQSVLHAHQRQRVPLKVIVDQAKLDRDASRNPLFQNTFIVQDPPMALDLAGLRVQPLFIHNDTSKFDMAVWMWDSTGPIAGVWEYNTDLFDADTIDRMILNFETFLASAVTQTESPWRKLPLLAPDEYRLVTEQFNHTIMELPPAATVVDRVKATVARAGESIALLHEEEQVSYQQLWTQSTQLAGEILRFGVQPGELVGIFVERSPQLVVAMLAIHRLGAAYVPLDPAFPSERLRFMIEDAGLKVIVSQSGLVGQMPAHAAKVVLADRIEAGETNEAALPAEISPSGLAYVRYTSGSTGQPKGVEISHHALVNFLLSMEKEPGLSGSDGLLAVTTLSFDISELEIWLPLIAGGRVVVANREQVADGRELMGLMQRHGVTIMQATPSTWRLLLEAGWPGDGKLKILCGGEALPGDLAEQLVDKCGALWNMYGPTETTVWSSALKVEKGKPIQIGGPIANTQFFVVDTAMQLVPLGVHGELLIGGDGLARGYFHRPELTADRFIACPFHNRGRLYRTGDLVRYRQDGTLDFLGRIDTQVKVRGYRIELGEIETALGAFPGIEHAVVAVRDDQLAAYYVSDSDQPIDSSACRDLLRTRLPEYMLPAFFIRLDQLPLTPNGKVDRKALPSPSVESSGPSEHCEAPPRTPVEKQLVSLWEQVLKRSPIGIRENFFDLGGHSLLAVNLFGKIETAFGHRLPLATLFQNPNVARLANLLESYRDESHKWRSLILIREGGDHPALFIVHGAGGNILIYRSLAHYLDPELPVYGLQSLGLDGRTPPLATVEEMATSYADEIMQKQPAGPYLLAGYCMGGKVAFEIARLLAARGHKVELLALLDSYNFESAVRVSRFSLYRQMIGFHLRNVFELKPADAVDYLKEKLRMLFELIGVRLQAGWFAARRRFATDSTQRPVENLIQEVNDRAGEIYVPRPYEGDVTLFKPHRNYSSFSDPNMGWRGVTKGRLELVALELNPHAMLVEPYVRKLADAVNARLPGSKDP